MGRNVIEIRAIVAAAVFLSSSILIGLFFIATQAGYRSEYHAHFQEIAEIGASSVESVFHSDITGGLDLSERDYQQLGVRDVYRRYVSPWIMDLDSSYYASLFTGRRARWSTSWSDDADVARHVGRINRVFGKPERILYAEPVTVDGYVPWHGRGDERAIGPPEGAEIGSSVWEAALLSDIQRCRSGRIWPNAVRIFRVQHPGSPYRHSEPASGDSYWMTGAEIRYRGDLWGYYLIAYRADANISAATEDLLHKLLICFFVISAITASAASFAVRWRLGIK